jgi:plastocyanin
MEPNDSSSQPKFVSSASQPIGTKKSKRITVIALILLIALLASIVAWMLLSKDSSIGSQEPPAIITVTADGFSPATVKIQPGQSVTWVNEDDTEHQIAADETVLPDLNDSDPLSTGETYSYPFEDKGTYVFFDSRNPEKYQGSVIVE